MVGNAICTHWERWQWGGAACSTVGILHPDKDVVDLAFYPRGYIGMRRPCMPGVGGSEAVVAQHGLKMWVEVAVRCSAGGGRTYVGVLGLQGRVKVPSNKQHVAYWYGTYEFLKLVPYMTAQLFVLLGSYMWPLHMLVDTKQRNSALASKMLSLNMQQPSRHNLLDTGDRKCSI